jgi:uncharacterized membrane protein
MPLGATLLLVTSAFTHALWNLLTKRSAAPLVSLCWALLGSVLLCAARLAASGALALPPPGTLGLLGASGAVEAVYLFALTRAYSAGDLALAYPVSRGVAPPLIALWCALFLGERLPLGGYAGIAVLVLGIGLASAARWEELLRPLRAWRDPAVRWSLLAGLGISVYSVVDKLALRHFTPEAYNLWAFVAMLVGIAPVLGWTSSARQGLEVLRAEWRAIALGSVLVPLTSYLVLLALAQAPASYVAGLRGLSVPAGALLARLVLAERVGPVRALASVVLALGTACLAWSG